MAQPHAQVRCLNLPPSSRRCLLQMSHDHSRMLMHSVKLTFAFGEAHICLRVQLRALSGRRHAVSAWRVLVAAWMSCPSLLPIIILISWARACKNTMSTAKPYPEQL